MHQRSAFATGAAQGYVPQCCLEVLRVHTDSYGPEVQNRDNDGQRKIDEVTK